TVGISDLHPRNVDIFAAKNATECADDSRPVIVAREEHMSLRHCLDIVLIDADETRQPLAEQRSRHARGPRGGCRAHFDQGNVIVSRIGSGLAQSNSLPLRELRGVHLIDGDGKPLIEEPDERLRDDWPRIELGGAPASCSGGIFGRLTALAASPVVRYAATSSAIFMLTACCASCVEAPRCGVNTMVSSANRVEPFGGSCP